MTRDELRGLEAKIVAEAKRLLDDGEQDVEKAFHAAVAFIKGSGETKGATDENQG